MTFNRLYIHAQESTPWGWVVSISHQGRLLRSGVVLKDPLSPTENELCRWYLEDFIQKSPFRTDAAMAAEDFLLEYPKTLIKALDLDTLVFSLLGPGKPDADFCVWQIVVSQSFGCSDNSSIHRLFWETIESPEVWNIRLQVIVQRSLCDETGVCRHIEAPIHASQEDSSLSTSALNVLVVIARNLRTDSTSQYQDVSPGLAIDVLLRVQQTLKEKGSRVDLNIEIVRPGTFAALKSHLKHREEQKGPNYFQAIHFDLHGKIGDRAGRSEKTGILYFGKPWDANDSSTMSKDTTAVATVSVCRLVAKYNIPLVLLNACESASAGSGSEANMAQQFLKRGVQNVIGMSFRVSDRAVAIFLDHFYRSLFIDGFSVSMSAAVGRMAQRVKTNRPAKYDLQRKLRDGFVPVLYGGCEKTFLSPSAVLRETVAGRYLSALQSIDPEEDIVAMSAGCYAREFDLLRLERLMAQKHLTFLHGVAGVGKSVFLQHAASRWKKTRMYDVQVMVDVAKDLRVCRQDVLLEIAQQLKSQISQDDLTLTALDAIDLSRGRSAIDQRAEASILNFLKTTKSIVILEGLDVLSLAPFLLHLEFAASSDALPLIRDLINIATESNPPSTCHIIVSQRRGSTREIESLMGCKVEMNLYELFPHDLPEAIEFSTQIIKDSGEDVSNWKYADLDWMESTIELLQRIPGTLATILPLKKPNETWKDFYGRIQSGLFSSVDELKAALPHNCTAVKDLQALSVLPDSFFLLYAIFGLYWRVSPSIAKLLPVSRTLATGRTRLLMEHPDTIQLIFETFFRTISDHGYIVSREESVYVHPMFTIVLGAWTKKHITLANQTIMARKFACSLEHDHFRSTVHFEENWASNYLTTMRYCIEELHVEDWPLNFMASCCCSIPKSVPTAMQALLDDTHCQLLAALACKLELLSDQTRHFAFFSITLTNIAFRCTALDETKHEEVLALAELGYRSISKLPLQYHRTPVRTYTCLFLTAATIMLYCLWRVDSFRKRFDDLRCLLGTLHVSEPSSTPGLTRTKGTTNSHGIQRLNINVSAVDVDTIIHFIRNTTMMLGKRGAVVEPQRSAKVVRLRNLLEQILPEQSCSPFNFENSRWELYVSQMVLLLDPGSCLQSEPLGAFGQDRLPDTISTVKDVQDWFEACSAQVMMIRQSISQVQFQGAIAHLQSVQAVLNKVDIPRQLVDAVQSCHGRIMNAWQQFKFRQALVPTTDFDIFSERSAAAGSVRCPAEYSDELERLASSSRMMGQAPGGSREFSRDLDALSTDGSILCLKHLVQHDMEAAVLLVKTMKAIDEANFEEATGLLKQILQKLERFSARLPQEAAYFMQRLEYVVMGTVEYRKLVAEVYTRMLTDFDSVRLYIDDAVAHLKHFNDSQARMITKQMHSMATRHELVAYRLAAVLILAQENTVPKELIRNLFATILQKFEKGCFVELWGKSIVVDTCVEIVQWLIVDAAEARQWRMVLEYCQQYESYAPVWRKEDPPIKAFIFQHRKTAEHALVDSKAMV